MQESTFDQYLGHELRRLAFVSGGTFKITDVKKHMLNSDQDYLTKAYLKEKPKVTWNWNSYPDRMNRHVYRVVKSLGGARQKIRNRWVYSLDSGLLITHKKPYAYA